MDKIYFILNKKLELDKIYFILNKKLDLDKIYFILFERIFIGYQKFKVSVTKISVKNSTIANTSCGNMI